MTEKKIINEQGFQNKSSYWPWVVILIVILLISLIRIHLLNVPLERDEGEYAYAGQLILQGVLPYAEVYNMKMPGIYAAYALILAIFGQTHTGIHLGLLLVNTTTIILIFLLGKRLFDPLTGVVAGASFAVLSLGQYVQGIFANAEHFVILFAVGGILLLLRAIDSDRLNLFFFSGLLLGISFIMKQHGAAFIAFSGFYLLYSQLGRRPIIWSDCLLKLMLFSVGVVIPFGLTCLIFFFNGIFDRFWFWTFVYAREYVSLQPLSTGLYWFKKRIFDIVSSSVLVWILAGVGFTALLWDKKLRTRRLFVLAFLVFSFLSICPGFYFRWHYFVLLLPAVALLAGIGICSVEGLFSNIKSLTLKRGMLVFLVVLPLFFSIYKQRSFLFQMSPTEVSRAIYGPSPFPESLEIAKYIKKNSSKNDRIAVMGSEPQIYFYSQRRSATGYIYTYALMETHKYALKMQKEMINEIESSNPKFLVLVNFRSSWDLRKYSEMLIFEWFEKYVQRYYKRVGVVDIPSPRVTVYKWGNESIGYTPSIYSLFIFERKK